MTSTDVTGTPAAAPMRQTGRLIAWCAMVGGLAALDDARRPIGLLVPHEGVFILG